MKSKIEHLALMNKGFSIQSRKENQQKSIQKKIVPNFSKVEKSKPEKDL